MSRINYLLVFFSFVSSQEPPVLSPRNLTTEEVPEIGNRENVTEFPVPKIFIQPEILRHVTSRPVFVLEPEFKIPVPHVPEAFMSIPYAHKVHDRIMVRTDFVCGQKGFCATEAQWCPVPDTTCHDCRCDPECFKYNDCCPDMFNFTAETIQTSVFSCVSVMNKTSEYISPRRYFMRDTCLPSGDKALSDKCVTADVLPVFSTNSSSHYKNQHCAQCNNDGDTIPWIRQEICRDALDLSKINTAADFSQEVSQNPHCAVFYSPPDNNNARRCDFDPSTLISDCSPDGSDLTDIDDCRLYLHPVTVEFKGTFRNLACAKCNGASLFQPTTGHCDETTSSPAPVPTSILSQAESQSTSECPSDETDTTTEPNRCRRIFCPPGKVVINHECKDIFTSTRGLAFKIDFNLIPQNPDGALLQVRDISDLLSQYREDNSYLARILAAAYEKTQINITFMYPINVKHTMTEGLRVYNITVRTRLVANADLQPSWVEEILLKHVKKGWAVYNNENFSFETFNPVWLSDDENPDILSQGLLYGGSNRGNISQQSRMYRDGLIVQNGLPFAYTAFPEYYIPVNEMMNCQLVELAEDQFETLENEIIRNKVSSKTYSPGQYANVRGAVRVCKDSHEEPPKLDSSEPFVLPPDLLESVPIIVPSAISKNLSSTRERSDLPVTLTCSSLSLLCILIACVALGFFSNVHSLSTKNSMSFFANLFCAQLFSLVAMVVPVSTISCKFLGVAVHYFWLSTFSWMLTCCYFMYVILTKPFNLTYATRMYLKFCLFSQLVPAVFVGAYIAGNYIASETVGYGLEIVVEDKDAQLCFLPSKLQYGVGMGLPLGLYILVTGFYLIRALRAVPLDASSSKKELKSDGKLPKAYRTIFVVMVCTWIFGTLSMVFPNIYVWYVFVIASSSLGEFVLYSFMSFMRCGESRMTYYPNPEVKHGEEKKDIGTSNISLGIDVAKPSV